jgi:hypothetical protein
MEHRKHFSDAEPDRAAVRRKGLGANRMYFPDVPALLWSEADITLFDECDLFQ